MLRRFLPLFVVCALGAGCAPDEPEAERPRPSAAPAAATETTAPEAPGASDEPERAPAPGSTSEAAPGATGQVEPPAAAAATDEPVVLVAGGDVCLGREEGQRLLRDPGHDELALVARLWDDADLRFVNLESVLSDQHGETVHPASRLVFTGPPNGAEALARARIELVSLANNHAWDYGESALFETFDNLERAGVGWVGAGRDRARAWEPVIVERRGLRIAFVAVTAIWNQALPAHPGKERVADAAERDALVAAITRARASADVVAVSYHGLDEYVDTPIPAKRAVFQLAVDAGADLVLGHHPHVPQRAALLAGRPVFYSLGNLLMSMKTGVMLTGLGFVARIELRRGAPPALSVCPYRIHYLQPIPLAADERRAQTEPYARAELTRLFSQARHFSDERALTLGAFDARGCAPLVPEPER
ncbi:MAG: CapA family protein [Polyangiaceae bacterium]|nr:CapA family protein [Polyangiaceae bacterium]